MAIDDRFGFDEDVVDLTASFDGSKISEKLSRDRFDFGYETNQLVRAYLGLKRGIIKAYEETKQMLSPAISESLLTLWDLQTSIYILRAHKGLSEEEISLLEGEKILSLGLGYAEENMCGHLEKIMDARDRAIKAIKTYCNKELASC